MRRIQKHIIPLYKLLTQMELEKDSDNFWIDLDKALRTYFGLHDPELVEEEGLNVLLLEIHRKSERYSCDEEDYDRFFQILSLLKTAFYNHKLKTQRPEVSQEIKILTYLLETEGRLSEKDKNRLAYLYKLRKKI